MLEWFCVVEIWYNMIHKEVNRNNVWKIGQTDRHYLNTNMSEVSVFSFFYFLLPVFCLFVFFTWVTGGCNIMSGKTGSSRRQGRVHHFQILLPGEIQNSLQFTGRYWVWAWCFFFLSWTKYICIVLMSYLTQHYAVQILHWGKASHLLDNTHTVILTLYNL